jgi:hypothetical protein
MFKHFIMLEWKAFLRSASLGTNIAMKIFIGFFAASIRAFFLLNESGLSTINSK